MVIHPASRAEQRQTGAEAREGERERRLPPGRHRRAALDLGEPGALGVVGQAEATDAEVAGRLEQPRLPALAEPAAEPQVHGIAGLAGEAGPGGLGHPVVAEAVAGRAVDDRGDPAAAGVDGLEQPQVEGGPQAPGDRGRCRTAAATASVRSNSWPIQASAPSVAASDAGSSSIARPRRSGTPGGFGGPKGGQVPCRTTVGCRAETMPSRRARRSSCRT